MNNFWNDHIKNYISSYLTGVYGCPTSMNYLNLNSFNIKIGNGEKSFADANADCQSDGGQLAKVSSTDEFSALKLIHGKGILQIISFALYCTSLSSVQGKKYWNQPFSQVSSTICLPPLISFPGLNGKPNKLRVGITNPDGVTCVNSGCTNKVKWVDGTDFIWDPNIHSGGLLVSTALQGYAYNVETTAFSAPFRTNYVCVASCIREILKRSERQGMLFIIISILRVWYDTIRHTKFEQWLQCKWHPFWGNVNKVSVTASRI